VLGYSGTSLGIRIGFSFGDYWPEKKEGTNKFGISFGCVAGLFGTLLPGGKNPGKEGLGKTIFFLNPVWEKERA